jgi:hypothetical protein
MTKLIRRKTKEYVSKAVEHVDDTNLSFFMGAIIMGAIFMGVRSCDDADKAEVKEKAKQEVYEFLTR